jgi:hypothetical protein
MAKIEGLNRLVQQLRAKAAALKDMNVSVQVGYTAAYAVHVHENMETQHPVGQAKFLEQPAREMSNNGQLGATVRKNLLAGKTMSQSLLIAGLLLQRESMKLCPVDTGALRASAFTRLDTIFTTPAAPDVYGDISDLLHTEPET